MHRFFGFCQIFEMLVKGIETSKMETCFLFEVLLSKKVYIYALLVVIFYALIPKIP